MNARRQLSAHRRGAVAILAVLLMLVLVAVTALAVELGMLMTSQNELQRTADAAALAACWEYQARLNHGYSEQDARQFAREIARHVARSNPVGRLVPDIGLNLSNDPEGDIVFGRFLDFGDPTAVPVAYQADMANAVRVTVRRTEQVNGEFNFLFARLLGIASTEQRAVASASLVNSVRGFTQPQVGNLPMLPFAVSQTQWHAMLNSGPDNWSYDVVNGSLVAGSDGLRETSIFPHPTGSPGNNGVLRIGANNNSQARVRRQISEGLTAGDLAYHGGKLELNDNGQLLLFGTPGLRAGMQSNLQSIIGEPKILCLYTTVSGSGANVQYTIVEFVGVRVLEAVLTGGNKRVIVQPANLMLNNVIPGEEGASQGIYSPVILVQ